MELALGVVLFFAVLMGIVWLLTRDRASAVVLPTCTVQILDARQHKAQENCTVPKSAIAH